MERAETHGRNGGLASTPFGVPSKKKTLPRCGANVLQGSASVLMNVVYLFLLLDRGQLFPAFYQLAHVPQTTRSLGVSQIAGALIGLDARVNVIQN